MKKNILSLLDRIIALISLIGLYTACLNENVTQAILCGVLMITATIDYNFRDIQNDK